MDTIIFKSGNSQAVRIPKEFRLNCKIADISKCGNRLIIKEKKEISWNEIFSMPLDEDFSINRIDNINAQNRDLF